MSDWKPIKSAPWQTVIEVRNNVMEAPVLATRGYQTAAGVHPDDTFCTTVFTRCVRRGSLFNTPAGQLVVPTEWRAVAQGGAA